MTGVKDVVRRFAVLLAERFPDTQNILSIYAVIVSLIYSWTLITSFYKIPSWLFFLTIGQIFSIYAYSFFINLIESILMLIGILLLEYTIFYPLKKRNEFQSRSILMVVFMLSSSMIRLLLYKSYESSGAFVSGELTWWILTLLLGIFFATIIPKSERLKNVIEGIAERLIILLYVYIPFSILSLIIIIIRNIN
ncbi:MAG: hypothetical protein H7Y59_01760 [Anaerolineales bacterium]|nr:hypothetical protein [Anaerolineales bacterium]